MPQANQTAAKIKRDRFAHEWLKDQNATAAYKRAGYKATGNVAEVNGARLLKHPEVQAIIQAQAKSDLEEIKVDALRILQELARIAFADLRDLYGPNGCLLSPTVLSAKVAATIASIEIDKRSGNMKYKYHDKIAALALLAKHVGLLKDAPPPLQWNLDPATLAKMSTEELETALKHAEKVQDILSGKRIP